MDEDLARISPLTYQHVILNGTSRSTLAKLGDHIA